jgi:hypothetical protein
MIVSSIRKNFSASIVASDVPSTSLITYSTKSNNHSKYLRPRSLAVRLIALQTGASARRQPAAPARSSPRRIHSRAPAPPSLAGSVALGNAAALADVKGGWPAELRALRLRLLDPP